MQDPITIIVGAGAAGLLAARELSAAGKRTILLEADNAPGGRIHTLHPEGFSTPIEAGAEFIHGDLPLTLQLLKEAGIPLRPAEGKMIRVRKGRRVGKEPFSGDWGLLMTKMQELQHAETDLPMADFLSTRFPGEQYAGLRQSVKGFAEGYDLADLNTVSTLSLFREWHHEEGAQHRVDGGYGRLIHFLLEQCRFHGCAVHFSSPVSKVRWEKDRVEVTTTEGKTFSGHKLLITVSLGILQLEPSNSSEPSHPSPPPEPANPSYPSDSPSPAITFSPSIPAQLQAARQLGYGAVTKVLMEFRRPFWNKWEKKTGFILSDAEVPTWWTQSPDSPLLTGWVTGAPREYLAGKDEAAQVQHCLSSLASIFSKNPETLREQLVAVRIFDWAAMPYVRGGYSFETVASEQARKLLRQPVDQTLYFAGEALYEGSVPGTVEAALVTGKEAAGAIIAGIIPQ